MLKKKEGSSFIRAGFLKGSAFPVTLTAFAGRVAALSRSMIARGSMAVCFVLGNFFFCTLIGGSLHSDWAWIWRRMSRQSSGRIGRGKGCSPTSANREIEILEDVGEAYPGGEVGAAEGRILGRIVHH